MKMCLFYIKLYILITGSPDCSLSNFHFLYGEKFRVIVSCPTDKTYKNFTSVDECVAKACHRQKEVFGYNVYISLLLNLLLCMVIHKTCIII